MSQHRFPPLLATVVAGLVLAAIGAMPASAAAPAASTTKSAPTQVRSAAGAGGLTANAPAGASHPLRITEQMDRQLNRAPARALTPFTPATALRTVVGGSKPHREVFGYVNASNLTSTLVGYPTWDFNNLSTVALFGLHVLTDGSFSDDRGWQEWNSGDLTALLNAAHPNGVKVVPSIIFHDFSSTNNGTTLTPMCQVLMPAATSHTVADITSEVIAKGADGFNMDYEGNNQLCPNGQYQSQMLVALMQQLRVTLSGYYISIATYNGSYYSGYYFDIPGLNPTVDSFFLMDYDSTWSNYQAEPLHCATYCFSPNAPMTRYQYNDTDSVHGYLGLVPASKIILGVPYYGNTACIPGGSRPGPNAAPFTDDRAHWSVPRYLDSSTTDGYPGVSYFATGYDPYTGVDSYSTWYDSDFACWRESYWDNVDSLNAKYDLINQNNLRGVGIFTLDYGGGAPELWRALHNKFGGCIGAGLTATPVAPQPPGAVIHLTASSTACNDPVYEFWMGYPNGVWQLLRGFAPTKTFDWNTSGLGVGTYTLHVWANQYLDPTTSWDSFAELTYNVAVVPPCASATLTPANPSPPVGTTVSFTVSSTGCSTPIYEYWVQYPNGSWNLKRGFSSDPAWSWNTTGLAPGTYTVHAWANQYGDPQGRFETMGTSTVAVTGCSSATISPADSSPPAGSTVTLTVSAAGCSTPQFQFWIQYPDGGWNLKQGWGGGPTLNWSTAGLRPGVYNVHAWANQQGGSTSSYDVFGATTVTLTGCGTASVAPANVSLLVGSTFAFTASSTGCPNPQYAYWVLYPSGTWYMLRGFSSDPTWNWNTGGLAPGTYVVHAWANQQGAATSPLEAVGSSTATLSPPCSSAMATPGSGSTAAGTTVTFTVTSTGCTSPVYAFYLEDPSGVWRLMQGFTPGGATWTWNTSGWPKGVYTIHAWANQQGSNYNTYETFGSATRTVT